MCVLMCVRSVLAVFPEEVGQAEADRRKNGARCVRQKCCYTAGTYAQQHVCRTPFLQPPELSLEPEPEPPPQLVQQWRSLDESGRSKYSRKSSRCPEPSLGLFRPDVCFGSVSENFRNITDKYLQNRGSTGEDSLDAHRYWMSDLINNTIK